MYYKINNFIMEDGVCDYKSLDINKNIYGTQFINEIENYSILANSELKEHKDLEVLDEEVYFLLKKEIEGEFIPKKTLEEEIEELKQESADTFDYTLDLDFRLTSIELGL